MQKTRDVHFVYLGKSLPRYARASLELASRNSGLQVHLLANAQAGADVARHCAHFTAVEDFYNVAEFAEAEKRVTFNHTFRDGLFLRSLERFFVLDQYMHSNKLETIFHAELDQLLFRVDELVGALDAVTERGAFLPFHNKFSAVASVFYCNHKDVLRSFLNYSRTGEAFPNEMVILARWALENRDHVFSLPTLASMTNPIPGDAIKVISESRLNGIVDAAQLGQWVGGIDPRNVPILSKPKNHFVDEPSEMLLSGEQLMHMKLELIKSEGRLVCNLRDQFQVNLYNLHIHSKIHESLLRSTIALDRLFLLSNQTDPVALPGTRRKQIFEYLKTRITYILDNPEKVLKSMLRRFRQLFG